MEGIGEFGPLQEEKKRRGRGGREGASEGGVAWRDECKGCGLMAQGS